MSLRPDRLDITGAIVCLLGVSIISYFPAERMDEDLTPGVEAIAQGIGFGAAESFRARFRRIVRIAPRDYRRASASA